MDGAGPGSGCIWSGASNVSSGRASCCSDGFLGVGSFAGGVLIASGCGLAAAMGFAVGQRRQLVG